MTENKDESQKKGRSGCLWLLAILVALIVVFFVSCSNYEPNDEDKASEIGTACYRAVKEHLKDPDSANISDTGVSKQGDNNWHVEGTGTATNGFGGPSEFTWECDGYFSNDLPQANATVTE